MDKVRVGLWLGIRYLDRDSFPVNPNFYIAHRIGIADRVACVMLTDTPSLGLNFWGVSTIAFRYQPSSFALRINDLIVFNASTDFLIARRMGLPYPSRIEQYQGNALWVALQAGAERVMRPPLRLALPQAGTWLYQPMVQSELLKEYNGLWDTDYVRHAFWDVKTGLGAVFVGNGDGSISPYSQGRSDQWIPSTRYTSFGQAITVAANFAFKMQKELLSSSMNMLSKEKRTIFRTFERLVQADLRAHMGLRRSRS